MTTDAALNTTDAREVIEFYGLRVLNNGRLTSWGSQRVPLTVEIRHMSILMHKLTRSIGWTLACAVTFAEGGCGGSNDSSSPGPAAVAIVTVDTLTRFQSMTGWEASAQAGQGFSGFESWRNSLFDQAVNDLGINRLRLGIVPGTENPTDYYVDELHGDSSDLRCKRLLTVNDNSDANVINPAGFHFSAVDSVVVKVVLPMRQRLEARGEHLFLNLNYIAFLKQCPPPTYVHADPSEYGEFILAAFLHLRDTYGLIPDAVEIILEPDNAGTPWSGTAIGQAMVATSSRLSAAGFHPAFIAPSTTSMANAVAYADDIDRVSGARSLLSELSYHRYSGVSDENLAALAARAKANGSRTSMLEHIGSDVEDLYKDLTVGQVSAWQQYTLAYPSDDDGAQYFPIIDGKAVMGSRSRYLRQYFHYVRMGARRLGARSDTPSLRSVAFQNVDGRLVIVMHVDKPGAIEVRGLRPGSYGASITTSSATGAELGDHMVGPNGILSLSAPAVGVLTAYRK